MLVKPASMQPDHIVRDTNLGDVLDALDPGLTTVNDAAAHTYTALELVPADVDRTGALGGATADNWPTAAQIIGALEGNKQVLSPPGNALYGTEGSKSVTRQWPSMGVLGRNASFRRTIRNNNTGQTITMTAPASSGISVSGTMTIATNKWREFLFRILNSAPSCTLSATTVNGSKTISAIDLNLISQVSPGMSVYGTGIAANTRVDGVNLDAGTIHLDTNATADGTLIGLTFTPTVVISNVRAGDV